MITSETARTLSQFSHSAYGNVSIPGDYTISTSIDDPTTGFHAEIYKKTGTNEYIVAFTERKGTRKGTSVRSTH